MKESRDFHYYLCRQLKSGGMEIIMKNKTKHILDIVMSAMLLTQTCSVDDLKKWVDTL